MKEYETLSGGVKDTEVEVREQPTFVNLTYDHGFKICNGRRFLLEMQMWSQHFFHKRAAYYCSLSVQDQVRREKKYQKEKCGRKNWNYYFQPVFVVSFLNFPNNIVDAKEDGGNPYISHYVYRTKDTGKVLGDETNAMNKNDYGNILEERYEDGVLAGLEKGLEQGREETRLMSARKMKELGMENAIIAQVTGLSMEEIEKF